MPYPPQGAPKGVTALILKEPGERALYLPGQTGTIFLTPLSLAPYIPVGAKGAVLNLYIQTTTSLITATAQLYVSKAGGLGGNTPGVWAGMWRAFTPPAFMQWQAEVLVGVDENRSIDYSGSVSLGSAATFQIWVVGYW